LRCLVCQNQSIDDSDAPLARDLRLLIRERLVGGASDGEVRDFVVARYGEFVLLKPRLSPRTWVLWLSPFAVLLAAAAILWRRRAAAPPEDPLDTAEEARLRELLERDG
jgi:cytochrome c-type biogenesis protein CcmH